MAAAATPTDDGARSFLAGALAPWVCGRGRSLWVYSPSSDGGSLSRCRLDAAELVVGLGSGRPVSLFMVPTPAR